MIAIATRSDRLKNLLPILQPMKCNAKLIAFRTRDFSRALRKSQVIASSSNWFIHSFPKVRLSLEVNCIPLYVAITAMANVLGKCNVFQKAIQSITRKS